MKEIMVINACFTLPKYLVSKNSGLWMLSLGCLSRYLATNKINVILTEQVLVCGWYVWVSAYLRNINSVCSVGTMGRRHGP